VKIRREHLEAIAAHGRRGYPYEVCGALVGHWQEHRVLEVVEMKNCETEQPKIRYQMDPRDQFKLERRCRSEGLDVVGYYHTHPDHPPRPSPTDLARAVGTGGLSDGVFHIVMSVEGGEHTSAPCGFIFRFETESFQEESFEFEG